MLKKLNHFYTNNIAIINILKALIFFFVLFFVFNIDDVGENLKKSYQADVNEYYNSIVTEKGLDKTNRNTPYFILNNKSKSHIDQLLFQKIAVGDTLRKQSGQTILKIIRKDTILFFDFKVIYHYFESIYKTQ